MLSLSTLHSSAQLNIMYENKDIIVNICGRSEGCSKYYTVKEFLTTILPDEVSKPLFQASNELKPRIFTTEEALAVIRGQDKSEYFKYKAFPLHPYDQKHCLIYRKDEVYFYSGFLAEGDE